ncbi:MAG: adenylosuccinate synthetase [Flammeovirgaceae bacterium]
MTKTTTIVLGLGFGDEGKGITTDFLCLQQPNALVVRFNGGQQAGHTVVNGQGKHHVFSNFGSGTLRGVPSYMSRYCSISPAGIAHEYTNLVALGFRPTLYIDSLAMVTTPYDIAWNRALELVNKHGSCGLGFGATIERNESPHKLYAQDLLFPIVLQEKLKTIYRYYLNKCKLSGQQHLTLAYQKALQDISEEEFLYFVERTIKIAQILPEHEVIKRFESFVFEGAQGILLDMDYGFFPHVTRSNTTSKNALDIIKRNGLAEPSIYYVTRAYQTRHGNGPMTNEGKPLRLQGIEHETNQSNQWQGAFRRSLLDLELLNYALMCDHNHSKSLSKNLVVTCLDQLVDGLAITNCQVSNPVSFLELIQEDVFSVQFNQLLESHSPCADHMDVTGLTLSMNYMA